MSRDKDPYDIPRLMSFLIIIIVIVSLIKEGVNDETCTDEAQMESMIQALTSHKGIVTQESAMVWRAYVLDYTADGYSAHEATFELLKKFEANELPADSLTTKH